MEFPELLSTGWQNHEKDSEGVATRLEENAGLVTDATRAAQVAALASHTIGEHLGDWARAVRFLEKVTGALPREPALVGALGNLAVARFFADDPAGFVVTETEAGALAGDGAVPALVRVRMLLASGLQSGKRPEDCAAVYRAALTLADSLSDGHSAERAVAITSNNLASELLGTEDRSEGQTALMLRAAEAARTYWVRVGTWENDERADYLLACVHNAAGEPAKALEFARRGLATIEENGDEKVDEAFLRLAAAAAHRGLGDGSAHAAELAAAEALGAEFPDEGLQSWFESEAAKVR